MNTITDQMIFSLISIIFPLSLFLILLRGELKELNKTIGWQWNRSCYTLYFKHMIPAVFDLAIITGFLLLSSMLILEEEWGVFLNAFPFN